MKLVDLAIFYNFLYLFRYCGTMHVRYKKQNLLFGAIILNNIIEVIILLTAGVFLLRLAGRKSISQLTIPQTVIMISIGSLIVQPVADKDLWKTLFSAFIFIFYLVLMEYLQLRFNWVEKLMKGQAVIVIKDGILLEENMKKLRLTVDQLEVRLRQEGIMSLKDIKMVTFEANGQIGYELKRESRPLTVGEFEKMMKDYITEISKNDSDELFNELIEKRNHGKEFK